MTTYLVSRHLGAVEWMKAIGHHYDQHHTHLTDYSELKSGDTVVGSLPINMVADLNKLGVKYLHLSLYIPQSQRGIELTSQQLLALDAKLEAYEVTKLY